MGTTGGSTTGHEVVQGSSDLAGIVGGAGRSGLVAVTDGDADSWLGQHQTLVTQASSVSIVSLGEQVRSTTADTAGGPAIPDVRGVSNAGDIATLGRHVTEAISNFEAQGLTPVVVLDAVEPLVEATGLEATFRVIHLLSARARGANGRLVTVLPDTLDENAAETLATLAG